MIEVTREIFCFQKYRKNHADYCVRGTIKNVQKKIVKTIWEFNQYGRVTMKRNTWKKIVSKKIFAPKSQASKILAGVPPYNQGIHIWVGIKQN